MIPEEQTAELIVWRCPECGSLKLSRSRCSKHMPRVVNRERIPVIESSAVEGGATVERVARAMNLEAGRQRGLAFEDDWNEITEQERGGWRLVARAGLGALSAESGEAK